MNKFVALVVGVVVVIAGYIYLVSRHLPLSNDLQPADAIVAISGGDTESRTNHAIKLYHEGWAPKLIFSGAAKDPSSPSNARVMQRLAIRQGVPITDTIIDEDSRDTKENALTTHSIAGAYQKIILVTSEYHQRRAFKEFKKTYGQSVTIINSPAKDKNWSKGSWWITPYGWWISLTEPLKLVL